MQRYTMQEAAGALDVSMPTLRAWCQQAHIEQVPGRDRREHTISASELDLLARVHSPVNDLAAIVARLAALEAKVGDLTKSLKRATAYNSIIGRSKERDLSSIVSTTPAPFKAVVISLVDHCRARGYVARTARDAIYAGKVPCTVVAGHYYLTTDDRDALDAYFARAR